jgi:hypothetical protein
MEGVTAAVKPQEEEEEKVVVECGAVVKVEGAGT